MQNIILYLNSSTRSDSRLNTCHPSKLKMDPLERNGNNPPFPRQRFAEPTQAHQNRTAPGHYPYGGRDGGREHPNLLSINTNIPPVHMPHAQVPSFQTPPIDMGPFRIQTPQVGKGPFQAPPIDNRPFQTPPIDKGPFQTPPIDKGPFQTPPVDNGPFQTSPIDIGPFKMPPIDMGPFQAPPTQNAPPPKISAPAPAPQYHPANVSLAPPPPPPGFSDLISLGVSPGTPPGIPSETLRRAKEKIDAAIAAESAMVGLSPIERPPKSNPEAGFSPTQRPPKQSPHPPNNDPVAGISPTQGPPSGLRPLDFDLLRTSDTDEVNPYHLSTWEGANQSNDGSPGPVVIKLGMDNYLNWTIFIYRKIELNGWNDLVPPPPKRGKNGLPLKRARLPPPVLTPELVRRQLECSTFILEHIQERYWHMITAQERDPWIMMAEISDVWCTSMPVRGRNRFFLGLQGLEIGQSRVFDYFAQFKWLYESFKHEGGRLSKMKLYKMLFRGLQSRFPDLEYHGLEPGEELNPIFNVQQLKTSLDYMRSYLEDEFKLTEPEQLIITVPHQPYKDSKTGPSNGGNSEEGYADVDEEDGGVEI
ncbi:hypothetical protein TWF281_007140 [Arthrobotrys megalospora]